MARTANLKGRRAAFAGTRREVGQDGYLRGRLPVSLRFNSFDETI